MRGPPVVHNQIKIPVQNKFFWILVVVREKARYLSGVFLYHKEEKVLQYYSISLWEKANEDDNCQ